jgi:hypothetical protein
VKEKVSLLTLVALFMALSVLPVQADAPEFKDTLFFIGSKDYVSNGYVYHMDVAPFVENGRTYIPVRYLAASIGITGNNISWDPNARVVGLRKGSTVVNFPIDLNVININGSLYTIDTPPLIRDNRVFLPARHIAEAFGETVSWEPETSGVRISRNNIQPTITPPVPVSPTKPITAPVDYEDKTPIQPYVWEHGGAIWTWTPSSIPQWTVEPIIEHYRKMPHPHRTQLDYVLTYCTDKDSLAVLEGLASSFERGAIKEGLSKDETPYLAIAFVQSFPYVTDSASSGYDEYPRYPMETLVERKGDCEDTAILTATLLRKLNYDVALIFLPNHCAVGIWGEDDMEGVYYTVQGKRYYYLETTDIGWNVGELPDMYKNQKAIVLPLP